MNAEKDRNTPYVTPTDMAASSYTPTGTPTVTPTDTPTNTPTNTPTESPTPTSSPTPTLPPDTLMEDGYSDLPQVYITSETEINRDEYTACSIRIVDNTGTYPEWSVDSAVIKIRGNLTAYLDKKSYNIKLSEKAEILGMTAGKKWCFLANDYDKTRMRNEIAFSLSRQFSGIDYTMQSTYADVWLDGDFVGNYLITTAIRAAKNSVDIDEKNGDFMIERENTRNEEGEIYFTTDWDVRFRVDEPEEASDETVARIKAVIDDVESAIATQDIDEIKSRIDVDSFIDFYILEELMKNIDFNFSSTRYYYKDGLVYAGPVWDFDLSTGNCSEDYYGYSVNDTSKLMNLKAKWPSELLKCAEFRTMMADRYYELQPIIVNVYEDNELGKNLIDSLQEKYGYSFARDFKVAGWGLWPYKLEKHPQIGNYADNVEYLRKWLKSRNEALLDYFYSYITVN